MGIRRYSFSGRAAGGWAVFTRQEGVQCVQTPAPSGACNCTHEQVSDKRLGISARRPVGPIALSTCWVLAARSGHVTPQDPLDRSHSAIPSCSLRCWWPQHGSSERRPSGPREVPQSEQEAGKVVPPSHFWLLPLHSGTEAIPAPRRVPTSVIPFPAHRGPPARGESRKPRWGPRRPCRGCSPSGGTRSETREPPAAPGRRG